MVSSRNRIAKGGAVLAALALVLSPAVAAPKSAKKRASADVALNALGGIGSFTPAAANPRTAALFARSSSTANEFSFTPSAATGKRRAVNVVVRSRGSTQPPARRTPTNVAMAETSALEPAAYNLGIGVGWKRFALNGEITRVESNLIPGRREMMDLGVAYVGKRWSTRLGVNADRSINNDTVIDSDDSYSIDLGGSFAATKNLQVTGGLRYKTQREHLDVFADDRRDSQAVYIGTAFRF
jgi:hypothetical protein